MSVPADAGEPTQSGGPGQVAADAEAATAPRPSRAKRVFRVMLFVGVTVLVALLVQRSFPAPDTIIDAIRGANVWWVGVAVVLQSLSVLMLSIQQRQLLILLGTPVRSPRMAAITVASTAVSLTMPAGGAVGAGWSFRQYRLLGASRSVASTVMVVSGLAGTAGLAVLVGLMWSTFRILQAVTLGSAGAVSTCAVLVLQSAVLCGSWAIWSSWRRRRSSVNASVRPAPASDTGAARGSRLHRIRYEIRSAVSMVGSLGRRSWRNATVASMASRLFDCWCLYVCSLALGASVNVVELALVYLGIQLVRQFPFTPGGVGVVEVALLTGLAAIGVGSGVGAAVVVVYRLISAWLLVPIGYTALVLLGRGHRDERR